MNGAITDRVRTLLARLMRRALHRNGVGVAVALPHPEETDGTTDAPTGWQLAANKATGSDASYLDPNVPLSKIAKHGKYLDYLTDIGNREGMRVLEVGSREVTGKSEARTRFANAQYVGFDYYPGPNVDVVGDAHKLSQHFADQKFDIIYSSAVFEHFAMPWLVAAQMVKVLKLGGVLFAETHFSFSSHERPWHFFQFSDMALRVLFSPAMGIECIEAGMSNPIVGRFSSLADEYLRFRPVPGLYCHSEFLGRKTREISSFSWDDVDLEQVVGETKYPPPK